MVTPTIIASQTVILLPFAKRKGTRASEASSQGMPVQDPSERSSYPANVFPSRRAEEATTTARGTIER